jgi:hypothetical protein
MFLPFLLLSFQAVSVETVLVPLDMAYGFCAEETGRFLVGERRGDREVRLVRYEVREGKARKLFEFPQKFEGPLEVFVVEGGVIVGDYASGFLGFFSSSGKEFWRLRVQDPNAFRLSLDGMPWMFFNSLLVYRKTPDSNVPEPVLDQHGAEILLPAPVDIAPVREMTFYSLDFQGDLYEYPMGLPSRLMARETGMRRILAHPAGGVLGYGRGEVVWFLPGGARRVLYKVPSEWVRAIRHMAWMPGGKLALAGSFTDRRGEAPRGVVLMIKIDRLGAD